MTGSTGRRVAGYELGELLATGATSVVHRARRVDDGQVVALKRVRPEAAPAQLFELVRQQAYLLRAARHRSIAAVHEVVRDGDGFAIALELVEGQTLAGRLHIERCVAAPVAINVVADLAAALAAAHAVGVLHLDLSPANVLLAGLQPVLIDFDGAVSTVGGRAIGTPGYVDPALASGGWADERSDIYGLGAVCFHALVGRPPHVGERLLDAAPDVVAPLAAVVDRALAPLPADRYQTAGELEQALRGVARVEPRAPGPTGDDDQPLDDQPEDCIPPVLAVTRDFGPRPPRPESQEVSRSARSTAPARLYVTAAAAIAAIAVGALTTVAFGQRGAATAEERRPKSRCPSSPAAVAAAGAGAGSGRQVLVADTGAACPMAVMWRDGVVEIPAGAGRPASRFRLGEPGDALVLGDWTCRGHASPGLYRPATGEVWFFDGWARPGEDLRSERAVSTGIRNGRVEVMTRRPPSPGRCATVRVRSGTQAVETA